MVEQRLPKPQVTSSSLAYRSRAKGLDHARLRHELFGRSPHQFHSRASLTALFSPATFRLRAFFCFGKRFCGGATRYSCSGKPTSWSGSLEFQGHIFLLLLTPPYSPHSSLLPFTTPSHFSSLPLTPQYSSLLPFTPLYSLLLLHLIIIYARERETI